MKKHKDTHHQMKKKKKEKKSYLKYISSLLRKGGRGR